jgi:D-alanine-D-alanine ligase
MKTVAVIFGGRSAEHDISIVTGIASIIGPLRLTKQYKVEPVYISKDGAWYWDDQLSDISLFTSGKIENFIQKSQPLQMQLNGGLSFNRPGRMGGGKKVNIDVVFSAMHGTFGEDGSLMGLLEMANIPYVGCNLSASVLAMDKVLAKQISQAAGVPIAKYEHFTRTEFEEDNHAAVSRIEKSLKFPLFVKPAHLGSSIGISRVTNRDELVNGIEVALHYDNRVIVEEEIPNLTEVTLPIMGNHELTPALLERPLTSAEDFFDFETKYMSGGKKGGGKKGGIKGAQGYSEVPAKLPEDLYKKAEQTGLDVYRALGCSGTARVDMLIDSKASKVYFNEVNPLPGSLYAHNWRAAGVSSVELVQRLITLAEDYHTERSQAATSFSTNFLQQF